MFCKQGIDISSRGSFEPAKRLRIIVRVLSRNLLLYLLLLHLLLLLRPPPPPPPPSSRCPLSPNALHLSPPPFKPPRHLFYLHYTPNSLLDSVGSAGCPSFLTPGFATPLPSLLDLLSLSLLSSFSLLDGYRSIYPPLLFILILCFISVLPLQSLEIYSYLTRSPVSFSTSRNAFSWCSRSDTSLLSLQRCPCKSDLGSGNAKPLGSRR